MQCTGQRAYIKGPPTYLGSSRFPENLDLGGIFDIHENSQTRSIIILCGHNLSIRRIKMADD